MMSHPHVVRRVEEYGGHYVVYSMGNLLSGQSKAMTDLGIMVRLTITKRFSHTIGSGLKVLPTYRDQTAGAGRATYRTLLISEALARPDALTSSSDRSQMRTYWEYCGRMFGRYR